MHLFHLNNLKWVIHSLEHLIKILGSLPACMVGGRNAYSKGDEGEKWKRKLGGKGWKKQLTPNLFSQINGNILVTITLKGQPQFTPLSQALFLNQCLLSLTFKKGPKNVFFAFCSPQATVPWTGSLVLECQNTYMQWWSLP